MSAGAAGSRDGGGCGSRGISVRFEVKCSLADEVFNLKSMSQALPLKSSVTFEVKRYL